MAKIIETGMKVEKPDFIWAHGKIESWACLKHANQCSCVRKAANLAIQGVMALTQKVNQEKKGKEVALDEGAKLISLLEEASIALRLSNIGQFKEDKLADLLGRIDLVIGPEETKGA